MSFSFFETKNINHFKYWRKHLTFWQAGTLSGTTISHKDYWDSLYFHEKFLKNVKLAQRYPEFPLPPPPPSIRWVSVAPSLAKLFQAVVGRNDQANFQSTLNKGAGGASLTIFATDCWLKGFCKYPKKFFWKSGLSLRRDYIVTFISKIWGIAVQHLSLNKKQKNLPHVLKFFWNQAWHGFWCRSYELTIFEKLISNVYAVII